MGRALGDILPLAVAAAIRPGSTLVIVLLLTTRRGRVNGLAFTAGFMASIACLGVILLIIAEVIGPDDHGSPKTWASVAKIIIGLVLIAGAIRTWVAQPAQGEGIPRRWLDRIDDITASVVAGLGAAVGAFNGKNFLLTAAAAVTIAQTGIRVIEQFVPLAVYVAIAGLCVLAPVAAYLVFGDRAAAWLNRLREWLVAHGPAIMGILFLLIGLSLIGGGIRELSG